MKQLVKIGLIAAAFFYGQNVSLASDHIYGDDNSYFASKYHKRNPHHWRKNHQSASPRPKHWGRHHHHGIALDGNDGRP